MSEGKTFPCPGCGSMLEFDPALQQLVCPACGNQSAIVVDHDAAILEYPLEEAEQMAPMDWSSATATVKCGGCGTETVVQADSGTTACPFCGSRQLVRDEQSRTIRPESLIPFKVPMEDARNHFRKWIGKKWFAPNAARKSAKAEKPAGIYIPYWTYDTYTDYQYSAEAGTYYYVTEWRTVRDSNGKTSRQAVQVRKTSWRTVYGNGSRFFDDVPINASGHESRHLMEKLDDYEFTELVPYQPQYLLGFLAERYSIHVREGFDRACQVIRDALHVDVRRAIAADEVRNIHLNIHYGNVRFKHLLTPIWLASFAFGKKTYRFVVNGQTGNVQGEYLKSPWKILLAILFSVAVIVGVVYLIELMQQSGW